MSFFEGSFNPSAWSLVTDTFPKRRHGLMLGLVSLTYPVGTAAALMVVNLVIAVLSLTIGIGSDLRGLRWSFGGAVLLLCGQGIVVCLGLLRTVRRDMAAQQALVRARTR